MSRARDIADTGDNNLDDIVVDGSGNVGIGTSSPSAGAVGGKVVHVQNSGATASIRVDRSDASTAGTLSMTSGNTTNGFYGTGAKPMVFYTDSSERMTIDSSGNVLVGVSSVPTGTTDGVAIQPASAGQILSSRNSTGGVTHVDFKNPNGTVGFISTSGSSTTYSTSSDYRLKENVVADWDATTRLKQLNPVRFNFIADSDTTVDGFLAHEVQDVVPEAITGTHNEVDDEGNPVYQGIDQSKLVPLLVKTIQELEARIAALENV